MGARFLLVVVAVLAYAPVALAASEAANEHLVALVEDHDLYVVISTVGWQRGGDGDCLIPAARVARVDLHLDDHNLPEGSSLETVLPLKEERVDVVKDLTAYGLVFVLGQFEGDSIAEFGGSVRVISVDKPWNVTQFSPHLLREPEFLVKEGRPLLVKLSVPLVTTVKEGKPLTVIDLKTQEEQELPIDDIELILDKKGILLDADPPVFGVYGRRCGPAEDVPPQDMLGDETYLHVVESGGGRWVLRGRLSKDIAPWRTIYYRGRSGVEWATLGVRGDRTEYRVLGPWLTCRIGWDYPEADRFGPVYTGEWQVLNLDSRDEQWMGFDVDSKALLGCEDFLLVRDGDALRYIGTGHRGSIDRGGRNDAVILSHPDIKYVQAAFFGPKRPSE